VRARARVVEYAHRLTNGRVTQRRRRARVRTPWRGRDESVGLRRDRHRLANSNRAAASAAVAARVNDPPRRRYAGDPYVGPRGPGRDDDDAERNARAFIITLVTYVIYVITARGRCLETVLFRHATTGFLLLARDRRACISCACVLNYAAIRRMKSVFNARNVLVWHVSRRYSNDTMFSSSTDSLFGNRYRIDKRSTETGSDVFCFFVDLLSLIVNCITVVNFFFFSSLPPATTYTIERSFGTLKIVRKRFHSTMADDRLCHLEKDIWNCYYRFLLYIYICIYFFNVNN